VKLARSLEAFDSLRVLVGSIKSCIPILLWAAIVLFLFQVVTGMFLTSVLMEFVEDPEQPLEPRMAVFGFFGTFSRSTLTMWELTLGNYAGVCRVLVDDVNELYGFFIVLYKLIVGFAMVRVISGVFLHETFKTAASDDDLMVVQKMRAQHVHGSKMKRFMRKADSSGDGSLQREELKKVLCNPKMKTWFAAQELDVTDADLLFDLLANGDDEITGPELVGGIARLKGPARSIDLYALMHMTSCLEVTMKSVLEEVAAVKTGMVQHSSKGQRKTLFSADSIIFDDGRQSLRPARTTLHPEVKSCQIGVSSCEVEHHPVSLVL